ncbi:TPA: HNH endonuclease [Streptococcus suis]
MNDRIKKILIGFSILFFVPVASNEYVVVFFVLGAFFYGVWRIFKYLYMKWYFNSAGFLEKKSSVQTAIDEYNEIADYLSTLPGTNDFGATTKQFNHSHLAKFENTSVFNMNREKNKKTINSRHVHQASLQIVRRASEEPIKYLTKYFNINADEDTLTQLEEVGENLSRFNNAKFNLDTRLRRIMNDINPPKIIKKFYPKELTKQLHFNIPKIKVSYPEYVFEYVSSGGNSSQRTTITLDQDTIDATVEYLDSKIKYKKSAKAQRALMTQKFRKYIKERDHYTCQICGASTKEQDLLLLEVDHIIPVSKGGLSIEENLQTLCWKCNRTKSNK